jgi:hypothetical protein
MLSLNSKPYVSLVSSTQADMNDFITLPISHAVLRDTLMKHLFLPSVPEGEDESDVNDVISPFSPASHATAPSKPRLSGDS